MCKALQDFTQKEYTRVLDTHQARTKNLSQRDCEKILMDHGASYEQAKNGTYVYLHHWKHMMASVRGIQEEYDQILDAFNAYRKRPIECIRHLEHLGFSYGQAKTAVHKYRQKKGLIRRAKR